MNVWSGVGGTTSTWKLFNDMDWRVVGGPYFPSIPLCMQTTETMSALALVLFIAETVLDEVTDVVDYRQ